ncbi:Rab family GTPase [Entamoeba histolytica HM-1:IMSS-B]|uniref:Rab family GTPase n=6 Tax=Entamoeba histolytica TaxID=5759 RepID=C4LYX3_ENTH1|nr:Rab family GTPase [Entamoeba histolytica HM-1:IMSS]EAL50646.2 Rab family GTPase [Entamoeba histolytica HM-1:IMSS]EMH72958.1 Rab family GTPase [Entamoeba histolytica HM-1:IMSS-B]ENY63359.1 Rab family GTPase, putative [Entamoeba histolytica HM-1:IMSS-A]GAT94040.1 Rab family GTPase [Entamoeba histolytica]|eukprot:XP_656067.2 Rab family GTPase [Entamoeba histolytica HM-1:IMSS]
MQYDTNSSPTNFKILVIGEAGVGKTCLLTRFTEDKFDDQEPSTSTNFKVIDVDISESTKMKNIKLEIYDTAGQERFRILTSSFYRKSCGIFLVFDLTDETSFKNLTNWARDITYYASPKCVVVLIGNKSDLGDSKTPKEEADEFVNDKSYKSYFVCSAKTGDGCKEALKCMALEVAETCAVDDNDTVPLENKKEPKKSKCYLF